MLDPHRHIGRARQSVEGPPVQVARDGLVVAHGPNPTSPGPGLGRSGEAVGQLLHSADFWRPGQDRVDRGGHGKASGRGGRGGRDDRAPGRVDHVVAGSDVEASAHLHDAFAVNAEIDRAGAGDHAAPDDPAHVAAIVAATPAIATEMS